MPQVILYQPEIPPNTGNVARTCAATGTELHLVEPLGFSIDDRQLKRAGLDYWPLVPLSRHADWTALQHERAARGGRLIALSSHGATPYNAFHFEADDWLLFGRETEGLPPTVLDQAHACLTIPAHATPRLAMPALPCLAQTFWSVPRLLRFKRCQTWLVLRLLVQLAQLETIQIHILR
jgi:tRNA (cytidine/uridine-2'-O-)-methyltransferase